MTRKKKTKKKVSVPDFTKFAFPLIRSIFPGLVANNLVNVQPMTQPGWLFAKYAKEAKRLDDATFSVLLDMLKEAIIANGLASEITAAPDCHLRIYIPGYHTILALLVEGKLVLIVSSSDIWGQDDGLILDLHDANLIKQLPQTIKPLIRRI